MNGGEGNNFVTFYSLSVERLACFAIVLYVVTQHSPCLWAKRYVTFERIARKETIKIKGTCPPLPSPVCTVVLSSVGVEFVIVDVV